ncbi:MAG: 3D domain-containing protein [Nitrosopumilaceae archaeon]
MKLFYYYSLVLVALIGIWSTIPNVNADDVFIPEWVFLLHNFWKTEQISDDELIDAIKYLQEHEIIDLALTPKYDILTNFQLSISLENEKDFKEFTDCRRGWYITGYYIPKEEDFIGDYVHIGSIGTFRADFLNVVKTEGWGMSESYEYVGWYDNSFHLNDYPQDEYENQLVFPTVAADPFFIKPDSDVWIPTLPYPWNEIIFRSTDSGPSIKGKHIDVFTGEGIEAQKMTETITSFGNMICMKP